MFPSFNIGPHVTLKASASLADFFSGLFSMIIAPGYEFMSYKNKKVPESLLGLNQNENSFHTLKKCKNALIDGLQFGTYLIQNDN